MTKKILSSSIIQQPYFPLQAPDTLPGLGLGLGSLGKKSLRAPLFSLQLTSLLLLIGCGGNSRNGGAGASITTTDSLDGLEADTPSTADADILAPPTVDQPVVLDVANPIMQDEATDEATVIDQVEPPALPQLQVTPVNNLSVDENSTALGDATSLSTSPQNSTKMPVDFRLVGESQFVDVTNNGQISLQKAPDFESDPVIQFIVEARHAASDERPAGEWQSQGDISITVVNLDDNNPVFTQTEFTAAEIVAGNDAIKTFTIEATDADGDDLTYSLAASSPDNDNGLIDPSIAGGVIRFNKDAFDYEAATRNDEGGRYFLIEVNVTSQHGSDEPKSFGQMIKTYVTNILDQTPVLIDQVLSVDDGDQVSATIAPATSTELGAHTLSYVIEGDNPFGIQIDHTGNVTSTDPIDFDQVPGDSLTSKDLIINVRAQLTGEAQTLPADDTAQLTIRIAKAAPFEPPTAPPIVIEDDTPPPVNSDSAVTYIENQTSLVFELNLDIGDGTRIDNAFGDGPLFTLASDSTNTSLAWKNPPDFEQDLSSANTGANIYTVRLLHGPEPLVNSVTLTVTVQNINDTPLTFAESHRIEIAENHNQPVYTAIAEKTDSAGSAVKYKITGGVDAASFNIDLETGELTFAGNAPDFERPTDANRDNVYEVIVRAISKPANDGGQIQRINQAVSVEVTNLFDEEVLITSAQSVTVNENIMGNLTSPDSGDTTVAEGGGAIIVYRTTITRDASGPLLEYSIFGADAEHFGIISATGEIWFLASPDYETKSSYTFTLQVRPVVTAEIPAELPAEGWQDQMDVTINLVNLDDNDPVLAHSHFTAPEIQAGNDEIKTFTLEASDADGDTITYSLAASSPDNDNGLIDPSIAGGVIRFNKDAFDYEAATRNDEGGRYFLIEVNVTSQHGSDEPKSFGQMIKIYVTNVLDQTPTLANQFLHVQSGADVPIAITPASSTEDGAPAISYNIEGDNIFGIQIDHLGNVTSTSPIDFDLVPGEGLTPRSFIINVRAQLTEGQQSLSADKPAQITVQVAKAETPPQSSSFTINGDQRDANATQIINYAENATIPVASITYDPAADLPDQNDVPISIDKTFGDGALFTLAGDNNNSLVWREAPDFEQDLSSAISKSNTYTVRLLLGDSPVQDTIIYNINVQNVNDVPLVYSVQARIEVAENQLQTGYTAQALKSDAAGAEVTYIISGGNDASSFTIDAETGVLSFAGNAPNFEQPTNASQDNRYHVMIDAVSNSIHEGGETLSATQYLAVLVTNVDDQPPVITSADSVTVRENIPGSNKFVGRGDAMIVYQATATKDAAGAPVEFSIHGENTENLRIDASTGKVWFHTSPDYETKSSYTFELRADSGELSGSKEVSIVIEDVYELPGSTAQTYPIPQRWGADGAESGRQYLFGYPKKQTDFLIDPYGGDVGSADVIYEFSIEKGDRIQFDTKDYAPIARVLAYVDTKDLVGFDGKNDTAIIAISATETLVYAILNDYTGGLHTGAFLPSPFAIVPMDIEII